MNGVMDALYAELRRFAARQMQLKSRLQSRATL